MLEHRKLNQGTQKKKKKKKNVVSLPAHSLNETQERAFGAIRARFELGEFGVQLLHGVTGSGKTEVLRAVQDTLARRAKQRLFSCRKLR